MVFGGVIVSWFYDSIFCGGRKHFFGGNVFCLGLWCIFYNMVWSGWGFGFVVVWLGMLGGGR
jgi:hypothetical protein